MAQEMRMTHDAVLTDISHAGSDGINRRSFLVFSVITSSLSSSGTAFVETTSRCRLVTMIKDTRNSRLVYRKAMSSCLF